MFKVNFLCYKNVLIAEVLDMPENYRSVHYRTKTIATRGDYAIKSVNYPEVQGKILYVWGTNKVSDKLISSYQYSSEEEAIKAMSMFEAMIEELNAKEETDEEIDYGVCPF